MRPIQMLFTLLVASGLLAPTAIHAADPNDPDAQEPIPGPTMHGQLRLSLADALAMGIENNLDVQIARHDPLIAYEGSRIAWGAYDPELRAETNFSDVDTPTSNVLTTGGANATLLYQRTFEGESGVRGALPLLNTQYDLSLKGDRTSNNNPLQNLQPEFGSTLSFALTQPVMKNLIWNESWTRVKISGIQFESALEDFRRELMDTVAEIEAAYWNLVATDEQERVAIKSLEQAQALLDQTEIQYEVGVVSRVEVVEAEAGVAERDVNLIRARNAHRNAQDLLIDRVLGTRLTAESRLEIDPIDRPGDYLRYEIDAEEAARKAFSNRPELEIARKSIREQEIQVKFAKNQRLPQVDVRGSIGYEGIAGRRQFLTRRVDGVVTPVPEPTLKTFGDSFDNYFESDGALQWSVGGSFSIPLGNIAARHRVSQADVELRRARTRLVRLQQNIILEIRNAARDLKSAQEGIDAAERRRLAAEEQFRAESIRLEQGESTPFDVLRRERDLVDAESQKIGAFQIYRDSVTGLERAQGTILTSRNIAVDQARSLR